MKNLVSVVTGIFGNNRQAAKSHPAATDVISAPARSDNSEIINVDAPQDDQAGLTPAENIVIDRLHQLRAPLADFTGRDDEIKQLLKALQPGHAAVISSAGRLGGVGATELAYTVADQLRESYPDAQLVVDLRGTSDHPLTPIDAMSIVIHAFQPEAKLPDDVGQVTGLYLKALNGKRVLLLLDNASEAAQVQSLTPTDSCALLITSRRSLSLPGLTSIALAALPSDQANAWLTSMLGQARGTPAQIDRLAGLCGRLPLALRVAGSFLKRQPDYPIGSYLDDLIRERLNRLRLDNLDIEAVLSLSYDHLLKENPALAQRWLLLSVFPASFDRPAAAAVWAKPEEDESVRDDLRALLRCNLISVDISSGRYQLHDVVRDFTAGDLSAADRFSVQQRFAGHYQAVLAAANDIYMQGEEDSLSGLSYFDIERTNILAGQAWAAAHMTDVQTVAQLCSDYPGTGMHVLNLRLAPQEKIRWLEAALAAARQLKDRAAEAAHLSNLGNAYAALRDLQRAIGFHEQALAIDRELGDRSGEGQDLGNLGNAHAALGNLRRAIDFYEQRLFISDRHSEGNALGNLGLAYAALGDLRRAIEFYDKRLAIAREIGDRAGEAQDLSNLGLAHIELGNLRRAIDYHKHSLTIAHEMGDRLGEGNALGNLGLAYADMGDLRRAIDYHKQNLVIAREVADRRSEGNALGNLGNAYADTGETRRAIDYYEHQLVIAREIGDKRGEGSALGNLGCAYADLGDASRAIELQEQALGILRAIGDRRAEGSLLGNLGNAYADSGDMHRAISMYEQHLSIAREIGDHRGEANASINMSLAYDTLGERAQAIPLAQAALKIFESLEDPHADKLRQQLAQWQAKSKAAA